ncbi:uncharacterized protein LOC132195193 [Neocloeon triangulifer]|uniref:uncharacterized protein LOC132195193 n=1 Tax=Neocloeon triangulifer TaxID=2078957 RepID=UPI00286EF0DB|nr:uncharacterized protein LOC132195193 [Neocloeon triangulifer]
MFSFDAERQRNLERLQRLKEHKRKYSVSSYKNNLKEAQQLRKTTKDAETPTRAVKKQCNKARDGPKVQGRDEKKKQKETTDHEVTVAIPIKRDDVSVALDHTTFAFTTQELLEIIKTPLPMRSKMIAKEESTKIAAAKEETLPVCHSENNLENALKFVSNSKEQPPSNPVAAKVPLPLAHAKVTQEPEEDEVAPKVEARAETKTKLDLLKEGITLVGSVMKNWAMAALLVGTGVLIAFVDQEHVDNLLYSLSTIEIVEHF